MTDKLEKEIDRLFSEEILPLAARLKSRNVKLLDTTLNKNSSSYFVKRVKVGMTKIDFETGGCASPDAVEGDLTDLWNRTANDGSLAALVTGVARLARISHDVLQEETGEISHFIYVMY